mgnify:CR=1 FL=1
MIRIIAVIIAVTLAGCSSNDKVVYQTPYCYTDQTISKKDGVVSSDTTLQCTDRPGQQMAIQRGGIDKSCEEFFFTEYRNGQGYRQRGVRCEKLNGSWEILNINGNYK